MPAGIDLGPCIGSGLVDLDMYVVADFAQGLP